MGKYRKRPVVIEAVQWQGKIIICPPGPEWLIKAQEKGIIALAGDILIIKTLEGEMKASKDDWIIKGVNGELYPCKPDIFEKTYEKCE
jgi:hypothetical protein